jgi:DNA replication protein DnaC
VDGYQDLEAEIAAVSVSQAKKYLNGDETAIAESKSIIKELTQAKENLLKASGIENDYLMPNYGCPDCQDTGYLQAGAETVRSQKCHCLKQAILDMLYEQSGIRGILKKENFDHLSYEYHSGEDLVRFQKAVAKCHEFCDKYPENPASGHKPDYQNLFFFGSVGTGKSFLSGCVAKVLIDRGYSVIYYTATGFFNAISRFTFDFNNRDGLQMLREDLSNCDLLIIDDLGTERPNDFTVTQLFSYLNIRHLNEKSTIISTNLSLKDLKDIYSARILSRVFNYDVLYMPGADIRMLKKERANMKNILEENTNG